MAPLKRAPFIVLLSTHKERPNFAKALVIRKYNIPVSKMAEDKTIGKEIPLRNIQGISKNIGKEGKTYQNVPSA